MINNKNVFYVLLSISIILFWLFFIVVLDKTGGIEQPQIIDNTEEVNALQQQNDALICKVAELQLQSAIYKNKIDSLVGVKKQIEVKYVTKYKEIMLANSNELSVKYDSLFAKFGVK